MNDLRCRRWVAIIILGGMAFRSIGAFRPLLGNFAMYQTACAMMARFFVEDHFTSLLYPKVNVLVAGKPGLLLLAYPVCSLIAGALYSVFGITIDFWGRFQSIAFFGGAAFYLYVLVRRFSADRIALFSLLFYALSPLTIIYGQSFQNEMGTVFFSLCFLFHLLQALERKFIANGLVSAFAFSIVLITRPNMLYLLVPAYFLGMWRDGFRPSWRTAGVVSGITVVGLVIPAAWFLHLWNVSNQASNIYSTMFAQLQVRSSFLSPLVFSAKYWKDLLDVLSGITMTPIGFAFFVLGLPIAAWTFRKNGLWVVWVAAFWVAMFLMPRKLIDHPFYLLHFLLPAVPIIAIAFEAISECWDQGGRMRKLLLGIFFLLYFLISMRYAIHPAFMTGAEDAHLIKIAERVRQATNQSDRIVVQGTHTLLYYADRYGWPFSFHENSDVSDYHKYTNWEKLSSAQLDERNTAFKNSVTALEYLRKYEKAAFFVVLSPARFAADPVFSAYLLQNYKCIDAEDGVFSLYQL